MIPELQFILLPRRGIRATGASQAANALRNLPRVASTEKPVRANLSFASKYGVKVLDSITQLDNGPKLVEMTAETEALVNRPESPLRALPIVRYSFARPIVYSIRHTVSKAHPIAKITFTVECVESGTLTPLPDCDVVAFDNFSIRSGDSGVTNANGGVSLSVGGSFIDRLYVYSRDTHWGAFRSNISLSNGVNVRVEIEPVNLVFTDSVRRYYGKSNFDHTTGVTVGIIDSGVGPHLDLNIVDKKNTVTGEAANDADDWDGHGTHVAGLIGSNGISPNGLRGIAPNIPIQSYRVFARGAETVTNYAILKAMILAAQDRCDIINLSIGGGPYDVVVEESIQDARDQGMLVVIAAGNDGRKAVCYPAAYSGATAVSAMGRQGAFPAGSLPEGDIERPPHGTVDASEFIAGFSNVGTQIAVTGLGSGVLSTLPNNKHGPMSGTSMAAPVVAGSAACLLSRDAAIFGMDRNQARSNEIEKLLQSTCARRGFGRTYEGYGLPDPSVV
jgi:subtilisin family serine protease